MPRVRTGNRGVGVRASRTGTVALPFASLRLSAPRPPVLPRGYPLAPNTFGQHLRRRRLDLGLTQRTLARRLGVREETVQLWESDRFRPLARHYGQVVRVMDFDPEGSDQDLPERLRASRRRAGLTQAELARRLRLDEGTVADLEAGRRRKSRRVEAAVAGFLHGAVREHRRGEAEPT